MFRRTDDDLECALGVQSAVNNGHGVEHEPGRHGDSAVLDDIIQQALAKAS